MFDLLSSIGLMALAPQTIPNPGLPDKASAQLQAISATTGYFEMFLAELKAVEESSAEVHALNLNSLGNIPLIVLSAGHGDAIAFPSDVENQQVWNELQIEQSELTALSSESKQIIAEQNSHFIQLDQPDLVIDAIREILNAFQN